MLTAKQHFEKLPEPHRTNCIKAMDKTLSDQLLESTQDAIFIVINWSSNPGMDYWENLHDSIVEGYCNG